MSNAKTKPNSLFIYAMWWRIGYGTTRAIFGVFLLSMVDQPFSLIIRQLIGDEVAETSPGSMLHFLDTILQTHPLIITTFVAWYVIFWGVMDAGLSFAMLRRHLIAFPISLSLIATFMVFEVIRTLYIHVYYWLPLIVIDATIWFLIYREYRREKQQYH